MGIFYEQTEIVNRTSKKLNVRFDGQDMVLLPNYDAEGNLLPDVHNLIPAVAVGQAKSQNVRMGSEAPFDPTDYDVLVGVKVSKPGAKQKDDLSFLEQSDAPTRVRLEDYLDDPTLTIKVGGRQLRRGEARETSHPKAAGTLVDHRVR